MKTIHLSSDMDVEASYIRNYCNHMIAKQHCRGRLEELLNVNINPEDDTHLDICCQKCYNAYLGIGFWHRTKFFLGHTCYVAYLDLKGWIKGCWNRFMKFLDN